MAYNYVRSVDANGGTAQSGSTATIALTSMSASNAVFVAVRLSSDSRSITNFQDSASSTWVAGPVADDTADTKLLPYYCASLAGDAPTVTVTFDTSGANNVYLWADEYTGLSSTVDQAGQAGNTGVPSVNPTTDPTTLTPDILWCGAFSVNASRPISTPAGMTRRSNFATTQRCSYDQRLTTTGAQSVTVAVTGGNSNICASIAAVQESAGPAVSPSTGLPDTLAERSGQAPYAQVLISGGLF